MSAPEELWTWAGHEAAQIRAVASATPAQRLAWLQDTIDFLQRIGAVPARTEARSDDPPAPVD